MFVFCKLLFLFNSNFNVHLANYFNWIQYKQKQISNLWMLRFLKIGTRHFQVEIAVTSRCVFIHSLHDVTVTVFEVGLCVELQQEARQLVASSETMRHSTSKLLQTFCMSLIAILRQTVAELFDYLPAGRVLCTSKQYSVTFCRMPEVTSVVIYSSKIEDVGLNATVKFGCSWSKRSSESFVPLTSFGRRMTDYTI